MASRSGWTTRTRWQSTLPRDGRTGICLWHGRGLVRRDFFVLFVGNGSSDSDSWQFSFKKHIFLEEKVVVLGDAECWNLLQNLVRGLQVCVGWIGVVPLVANPTCVGMTRLRNKVLDWSMISIGSRRFHGLSFKGSQVVEDGWQNIQVCFGA